MHLYRYDQNASHCDFLFTVKFLNSIFCVSEQFQPLDSAIGDKDQERKHCRGNAVKYGTMRLDHTPAHVKLAKRQKRWQRNLERNFLRQYTPPTHLVPQKTTSSSWKKTSQKQKQRPRSAFSFAKFLTCRMPSTGVPPPGNSSTPMWRQC